MKRRTRRTMVHIHAVTMMLTPLFVSLLLMQAEASGEEVQCLPTDVSTSPTMPLDEALFMAQCHLRCVIKHMNDTIALALAKQGNPQWPHLKTSDILAYGNCDTLEKVMECRRGCFIRSLNAERSRSACRKQCVSECKDECGTEETCKFYSSSTCPLSCRNNTCGGGCVVAVEVPSRLGSPPLTPHQPFTLVWAERHSRPLAGGLYNVSITQRDGALREGGGEGRLNNFVARVETNDSTHYLPLTSLEDVFDLSQFTCDTVNVSFAVVNQYNISSFSPPIEVSVYGERVLPSQLPPNGIDYTWVEDTRAGYEGTAVVNIMWERQEGHEYITSYEISLFSQTKKCGGQTRVMTFAGIGKEATYFVWRPMESYKLPVIDCIYQAKIRALPCLGESCTVPVQIIRVDTSTMRDYHSPMNLTCHKYVNATTGRISVLAQWVVENTPIMLETIKDYQILTKLMDTRGDIPRLLSVIFNTELAANGSKMAYLVHKMSPDLDENHKIFLRITPGINESFSWRQVPAYQECRVNIYPKKPSVPGANVDSFFVNETTIFLNLSLIAPETPFGEMESYEVVLVREPVPIMEEPLNLNLVKRTELEFDNDKRNGILNVENVNVAYRHIDESTLCLYLHIRARNEFIWSDWSEAIVLHRYPDSYNCSVIQEPLNEVSLYTYVGLSLCVVTVAVVAVLSTFTANNLYRRRRMKKHLSRAFQDPGYENPIFRRYDVKRRSSALWLPMDAPKADDWELPSANILLTDRDPTGEGCFGMVHRGVVKGPIIHSRTMKNTICVNVAVKFLKRTANGSERSDFLTEIDTMKMVAEGNNPHVANMIGCVTLQEPICLVTEFVKYGDLLTYLTAFRRMMTEGTEVASPTASEADSNKELKLCILQEEKVPPATIPTTTAATVEKKKGEEEEGEGEEEEEGEGEGKDGPQSPILEDASYDKLNPYAALGDLEPVNLISFAYQIASGMEYLSSLGIVHRDLACRNILIGEGKQLKISDFGMARTTVDEVYVKSTKGRLPWKWMAMESILTREFTAASDVWAYGVTLWEIGTLGGFPYPTTPNAELLEYLRQGSRLECPTNCSEEIYDIMQKCWQEIPEERPSFTDLRTMFAELLQENSPYIQLDSINTHRSYYARPHTLEDSNVNSGMMSGERLRANDRSASPSASSTSTPLDSSSYDLLKSSGGGEIAVASLEEQTALVPPNLYVNTPTKTCEQGGGAQPADRPPRPFHLSLDMNVDNTEL